MMFCIMTRSTYCVFENKGADQLRGNCEADQRLCFRCTDSTIPLLNPKFQVSSHLLCLYSSVCVGHVRKLHRWFSQGKAHLIQFCVAYYRTASVVIEYIGS